MSKQLKPLFPFKLTRVLFNSYIVELTVIV